MSSDSLVRRVAWVGAAGAAIGGVLAAAVAGLLAAQLVADHAEQILREDAIELASEILEELDYDDDDDDDDDDDFRVPPGLDPISALALAADHELEDVRQPSPSVAIFASDGERLIGDPNLPLLEPGSCEAIKLTPPRRACAVELDDRTLVLGVSLLEERERLLLMLLALLAGGVIGATLGGWASWRATRWALAPLIDLRDRVRRIDADAPTAEPLAPASEHGEIEELRLAIVALVERLAASLRHAQQFASQAAHELRTPLAVLAGELELLAESSEVDRPTIERLQQRVRELISLVQRLLLLAGSSKLAPEHAEAVDLADVIDAVRDALPTEQVERLHSFSEDDVIVRGDPELLRAMLANAIDNALKFSTDTVEVRATVHDSEAWLEVIDRGPGVSADDRERVFAPFFRSPTVRAEGTPGHGIGLALIRHVASVHAGTCEFIDVDHGARLRIRLPRW